MKQGILHAILRALSIKHAFKKWELLEHPFLAKRWWH